MSYIAVGSSAGLVEQYIAPAKQKEAEAKAKRDADRKANAKPRDARKPTLVATTVAPPPASTFPTKVVVIAGVLALAGVGYYLWRRNRAPKSNPSRRNRRRR